MKHLLNSQEGDITSNLPTFMLENYVLKDVENISTKAEISSFMKEEGKIDILIPASRVALLEDKDVQDAFQKYCCVTFENFRSPTKVSSESQGSEPPTTRRPNSLQSRVAVRGQYESILCSQLFLCLLNRSANVRMCFDLPTNGRAPPTQRQFRLPRSFGIRSRQQYSNKYNSNTISLAVPVPNGTGHMTSYSDARKSDANRSKEFLQIINFPEQWETLIPLQQAALFTLLVMQYTRRPDLSTYFSEDVAMRSIGAMRFPEDGIRESAYRHNYKQPRRNSFSHSEEAGELLGTRKTTNPLYLNLDHERKERTGFTEVVFGLRKHPAEIRHALETLAGKNGMAFSTRVDRHKLRAIMEDDGEEVLTDKEDASHKLEFCFLPSSSILVCRKIDAEDSDTTTDDFLVLSKESHATRFLQAKDDLVGAKIFAQGYYVNKAYDSDSESISCSESESDSDSESESESESAVENDTIRKEAKIVVVAAGTADYKVAEEAAVTATLEGYHVDTVYDVGVAGLHRLLHPSSLGVIQEADVVICVAGMEGALPSVLPTSVGYGLNLHGISAFLTMINGCAAGTSVVNIDSGFGAAMMACKMLKSMDRIGLRLEEKRNLQRGEKRN
eukprot:g4063.t1